MTVGAPSEVRGMQRMAMTGPVRGTALRVDVVNDIAGVLADWQALAQAVRPARLFAQPCVWQSWQRTMGAGTRAPVMVVRDAGRLVGVLPLMMRQVWRGPTFGVRYDYDPADGHLLRDKPARWVPLRQISPVLSLPATMLGPTLLVTPDRQLAVIAAVTHGIVALRGWDVAVIPLDAGDIAPWQRGFAAAGAQTAVQTLDRTDFSLTRVVALDALIAAQSQKFRANMRRARQVADRTGVRVAVDQDLSSGLPRMARLAAESWKAQGRDGQHVMVPYAGVQRAFFEDLLQAAEAPQAVIATAMLGDAPIAMVLGVAQGGTLTTLLTFWNGTAKDATPGLLAMAALVDWAAQNGMRRVDFNTNSPWLRYLTDTVTLQQNLLVFAPTWRGGLLRRLHGVAVRLRDARHRPDGMGP
jgi:CelD/BcsL family acetyltransferase involved in cellulose biosynthesis